MKRIKAWWRNVKKALDDDVNAHIASLVGDETYRPLHDRLKQEIPEIIAELESVTERLRNLV